MNLPESTKHLGIAIMQHRELLRLLRHTGTELGGGTVLAMDWNDHRRSTDLDFMMRAQAFDEHLEELKAMLRGIPAAKHQTIREEVTDTPIVVAARGVGGQIGDIEIVRDELGDRLRSILALPAGPRVSDEAMNAEAKEYILAKKFHRLERGHLERDHYDILWAAYHENDRRTLIDAAMHFTTPETVQTIAMEAQQDPEMLFKERDKRVLDPRAQNWKKVLGEVWQAVDKFTTDPRARNMRLPALKGAPLRKKPWGNW